MKFQDWYWKYIKESGLHLSEDTAIAMYKAALNYGYNEGYNQGIKDEQDRSEPRPGCRHALDMD